MYIYLYIYIYIYIVYSIHIYIYIYSIHNIYSIHTYIYIYVCVCVCVCCIIHKYSSNCLCISNCTFYKKYGSNSFCYSFYIRCCLVLYILTLDTCNIFHKSSREEQQIIFVILSDDCGLRESIVIEMSTSKGHIRASKEAAYVKPLLSAADALWI